KMPCNGRVSFSVQRGRVTLGTQRASRGLRDLALAVILLLISGGLGFATRASADVNGPTNADSVQNGNNRMTGSQGGDMTGGDAVAGGNVVGSAGNGNARIRVTND